MVLLKWWSWLLLFVLLLMFAFSVSGRQYSLTCRSLLSGVPCPDVSKLVIGELTSAVIRNPIYPVLDRENRSRRRLLMATNVMVEIVDDRFYRLPVSVDGWAVVASRRYELQPGNLLGRIGELKIYLGLDPKYLSTLDPDKRLRFVDTQIKLSLYDLADKTGEYLGSRNRKL